MAVARPAPAQQARPLQFHGGLLDAVRLTLLHEPGIAAANRQILLSEGQLQAARGEFDTVIDAAAGLAQSRTPLLEAQRSADRSQTNSRAATLGIGATSRLRSGVTMTPSVKVDHFRDNGFSRTAPATGTVALNFTFPLLKGRGTPVNTAAERAAELAMQSASLSFRHTVASRIGRTVNAYWDYLAALRSLEIRRKSEARSLLLLDDARRLAAGDEIPRSDVLQYEAELARDRGLRVGGEQLLEEARITLSLAMGILEQPGAALPAPTDDFPDLPAAAQQLGRPWSGAALAGRFDVLAQRSRVAAADILLDAARLDPDSQLDLNVSVGYSGLRENRPAWSALQALRSPASGLNASVGIYYVIPVEGNIRAGQVRQRAALAEQARLELDGLVQAARAGAAVQRAGLSTALLQLEQLQQQLRLQAQVFADERKKYRLGLATVLDLLTAESRLTSDELALIDARRRLAQSLVNYRLETATLLDDAGDHQNLTMESLTTLPELQ